MNKLRYDLPQDCTVHLVQVDSDVAIRGSEPGAVEIVVDGDPEQCQVNEEGGTLSIESTVALALTVPTTANVRVDEVSGDLVLRDLGGEVTIAQVHGEALIRSSAANVTFESMQGDLTVDEFGGELSATDVHGDVRMGRVAGACKLGTVYGDVRARSLNGPLDMGTVSGDVRIREAMGPVTLEEGMGDFKGTDIRSGMQIHHITGDLVFKSDVMPGCVYHGRADGNVIAKLPEGTNARFTLDAAQELVANLPEVLESDQGHLVGTSGTGEATVELSAGGSLSLKIRGERQGDFMFGLGPDLAAEIEAQITESLGSIDIDGLAQKEIEKAMRKAEREIERAREKAERERERAEERLHHVQERAQRAAQRAQERMARRSRHVGRFRGDMGMFGGDTVNVHFRRPKTPKVSESEQLAILKMVQEGTISTEDAEKLLKALEG